MIDYPIPVLGFAAYSGTGKTTLLEALLPKLTQSGLRVGMLKHAHHNFDVDKPGKDSYRLRKAGASQMLIASRNRFALMTETPDQEAEFSYLLSRFDAQHLDLILVEGCKNIAFPKIELHRQAVGKPWLYPNDGNIIAIASDCDTIESALPQLNINDLDAISGFVTEFANQSTKALNTPSCDTLSPAYLPVEQGLEAILETISSPSQSEECQLHELDLRVLKAPIVSPINVPAHNNSAMDGYAIRGDDLGRDQYKVVGEVLAGHVFDRALNAGEAVKIMTGAPTPKNADTVIMREQSTQNGDIVTFSQQNLHAGQNVRLAGEDLKAQQRVFDAGKRLRSPEIGMIASLGLTQCSVFPRLRVGVFSTGDEVQAPGQPLKDGAIYDSNRYVLISRLQRMGCLVDDLGILEDSHACMVSALSEAATQCDIIITSGGVSVGDADFVKSALESLGEINFWRINMRPGRPLAFGHIQGKPFFGLPGNPVAVMVSFLTFVEPAIRKMQGEPDWQPLKTVAFAAEELRSRQGRTEFSRGYFEFLPDGRVSVRTTGAQGSGMLRSMSEANCLIEIAPHIDCVKVGECVTIIPLQGRI